MAWKIIGFNDMVVGGTKCVYCIVLYKCTSLFGSSFFFVTGILLLRYVLFNEMGIFKFEIHSKQKFTNENIIFSC